MSFNTGGPSNFDGQPIRTTGEQVGGKGADGNFHIFSTDNAGALNVNTGAGASTSGVFNANPPTPAPGATVPAQSDSTGSLFVDTEGRRATYRMSVRRFVPIASATSPLFSIQGSATKVVRIRHIRITSDCTAGNATSNAISLQKFSALTGGVTGNTPTGALNDSLNAAQTAICLQYSTVPSTATVIGGISASEDMMWVTGSATALSIYPAIDWYFGDLNQESLVLRGVAEYYGIVVAAVGGTPLMSIWVEWTED